MRIANINEAKTSLSELIRQAIAGEDVYIARSGEPLVRLEPVARDTRPRRGGQWKGLITIRPDFDARDEEIERMFEESDFPHKTATAK